MSKMNYGTRFRGHGVAYSKHLYNADHDRQDHEVNVHFRSIFDKLPLYKQENLRHAASKKAAKTIAKKKAGPARAESEQRMAEAVRKVVEILEHHMDDMIQHQVDKKYPSYCNQQTIHNVIFQLRHKCGVKFTGSTEYDRVVSLTPHKLTEARIAEERQYHMEEQRRSKEAYLRALAEKFVARRARDG